MSATEVSTHLFWLTSRAAGTTALVLSSLAVSMGLVLGISARGRTLLPALSAPERRGIHEALALATMVAIAIHGLSLVGDSYLHPSLVDVTLPFVSSYKTLPTSLGIIAGWGLTLLGLSYYARRRIGMRRWRVLHRLTVLAWILGVVHTFTEGTDAGQPWFIALMLLPLLACAALLLTRLTGRAPGHALPRGNPEPSAT